MATVTEPVTPLEMFQASCEAAGIPPGTQRLDAFLHLPEPMQSAIWRQLQFAREATLERLDAKGTS
jgi:hypothetical protein